MNIITKTLFTPIIFFCLINTSFGITYTLNNNTNYLCTIDPMPLYIYNPIVVNDTVKVQCEITSICQNPDTGENGYTISLQSNSSHELQERLVEPGENTTISIAGTSTNLKLNNETCPAVSRGDFVATSIKNEDEYYMVMYKNSSAPEKYATVSLYGYNPTGLTIWIDNKSDYNCTNAIINPTTQVVEIDNDSKCINYSGTGTDLTLITGSVTGTSWIYTFTGQNQQQQLPINDTGNYNIQNAEKTITSEGTGLQPNTKDTPYYIIQYQDEGAYYIASANPADHPYPYVTFSNTENYQCLNGNIDPETKIITLTKDDGASCILDKTSGTNLTLATAPSTDPKWSHEFTPADTGDTKLEVMDSGYYKITSEDYLLEGSGIDNSIKYYIIQYERKNEYYISNTDPKSLTNTQNVREQIKTEESRKKTKSRPELKR